MNINTNRLVELTLVFFISLLSFSIGTFVGKKYSDNQHRLAQLEPNQPKHESAAADSHEKSAETTDSHTAAHPTKNEEMTDADIAKIAEEFATDDNSVEHTATETEASKKTATVTEGAKDVKEISLHESGLERDVASIPATAKTSVTYTVQVGSYPSEPEAQKMADSLLARGYKAHFTQANVNGKTMYRVQVGSFTNPSEAQAHKKDLMEKNRLSSAFVQKVTN